MGKMVLTLVLLGLVGHIVDAFGPMHPMLPMKPHFIGPPLPHPHMMRKAMMGPGPMLHGHFPPPHIGPVLRPMPPAPMPIRKFRPPIKRKLRPRPQQRFIERRKLVKPPPRQRKLQRPFPRRRIVQKQPRRVIIIRRIKQNPKWVPPFKYGYGRRPRRRPLPYYGGLQTDSRRDTDVFRGNTDVFRRGGDTIDRRADRIKTFQPEARSLDGNNGDSRIFSDPLSKLDTFNRGHWNSMDETMPRGRGVGASASRSFPQMGGDSFPNMRSDSSRSQSFPNMRSESFKTVRTDSFATVDNFRDNNNNFRNGDRGFDNGRNNMKWREPRLREAHDTGNRVEARKNALKPQSFRGSGRQRSLSGKTIDFTGSTVISSSKRFGTDAIVANTLDKNEDRISNKQISLEKDSVSLNNEKVQVTDIKTPRRQLGGVKRLKSGQGLGGSFIDLTGMGDNTIVDQQPALGPAPVDTFVNPKIEIAAATDPMAVVPPNVAADVASMVGGAGDIVILDGTGGSTAVGAGDGTTTMDIANLAAGATGGDMGPFDIVTLQEGEFAALQSFIDNGQSVSAEMINSIIGASGATGAATAAATRPGSVTGSAGPSPDLSGGGSIAADAAAPQIYIFDGQHAQQIAGSPEFTGTADLGPHLIDTHGGPASAIATAGHLGHSGPGMPHMGHGGHDIVGVVGQPVGSITVDPQTDIVGLFSMPGGDHHLPNVPASVSSIPESIGSRMGGGPGISHGGPPGTPEAGPPGNLHGDTHGLFHSGPPQIGGGPPGNPHKTAHCK